MEWSRRFGTSLHAEYVFYAHAHIGGLFVIVQAHADTRADRMMFGNLPLDADLQQIDVAVSLLLTTPQQIIGYARLQFLSRVGEPTLAFSGFYVDIEKPDSTMKKIEVRGCRLPDRLETDREKCEYMLNARE